MKIPAIRGLIDRRILINYRVDSDVLRHILPEPFRPQLIHGVGIAGICLIRLKHVRPRFLPAEIGVSSENAAHRIAVEWEQDGHQRQGVYVPRRDTSSWLNYALGGRHFPGVHHHARFEVRESAGHCRIVLNSDDGQTHVAVEGQIASALPATSIFQSLDEASTFFERGSVGYSATKQTDLFDGLELRSSSWHMDPLAVERVESSFFEDRRLFGEGAAEFDCALLMRGIEHEWHAREPLWARCGHDVRQEVNDLPELVDL